MVSCCRQDGLAPPPPPQRSLHFRVIGYAIYSVPLAVEYGIAKKARSRSSQSHPNENCSIRPQANEDCQPDPRSI